jgi:hypothetical protein
LTRGIDPSTGKHPIYDSPITIYDSGAKPCFKIINHNS